MKAQRRQPWKLNNLFQSGLQLSGTPVEHTLATRRQVKMDFSDSLNQFLSSKNTQKKQKQEEKPINPAPKVNQLLNDIIS